jgi:hypothetical protein
MGITLASELTIGAGGAGYDACRTPDRGLRRSVAEGSNMWRDVTSLRVGDA